MKKPTKKKILWACPPSLLDVSSGASLSARQMLLQLVKNGYEVVILSATIFDSINGALRIHKNWNSMKDHLGKLISVQDSSLSHNLLVTNSFNRGAMTAIEEAIWFSHYVEILDTYKPDLVWFYGGLVLERLLSYEAKLRGIPVAFYLVNGSYKFNRWHENLNVIFTDTEATSQFYKKNHSINPIPLGTFIDKEKILSPEKERKNVLFINPTFNKGVSVLIQVAFSLQEKKSNINFEIVDSHGTWDQSLRVISEKIGKANEKLNNVIITKSTQNMSVIYGRAKLLFAPSLWWESGARVLAESMINGIPAITTDYGGSADMVGDAGIRVKLDNSYHIAPYSKILDKKTTDIFANHIIEMYSDDNKYAHYCNLAIVESKKRHDLEANTEILIKAMRSVIG